MVALDRVIVVGAGVGGLTVALALKRVGFPVEVHERHERIQRHATGFTLWSYAIKHLMALGLDESTLTGAGCAIEHTEIRNQEGDLIELMPVGDVSRAMGAPSYDMRRPALLAALTARLGLNAVHMGSECVGIEHEGATATALLKSGRRTGGSLLIGADGIHSVVRTAVAGPARLRYSGYRSVSAVIPFSHPLLPARRHVEIWARGAKGGVADVGSGLVRWYVTYRAPDGARPTFEKPQILEHIRGWYPLLEAAVRATDDAELVPTEAWDLEPLGTWINGRAVLLGDAAHATTPFAAMGANMTIDDAMTLADLLASRPSLDDALAGFQQFRKARTEDVVRKGRTMGALAQLHNPIAAWLRDVAFRHMSPEVVERVTREMAAGGET